jgi:hypothetical protein
LNYSLSLPSSCLRPSSAMVSKRSRRVGDEQGVVTLARANHVTI